jgi:organic hydroperoxide reductase OsmC/OhrA
MVISFRPASTSAIPGVDRELAASIVHGAHQTCLHSKASRGNVDVEICRI